MPFLVVVMLVHPAELNTAAVLSGRVPPKIYKQRYRARKGHLALRAPPSPTPKLRQSALPILLSLIRAKPLPGSAPQALGHAAARSPSIARWQIRRASSLGLILLLPLLLSVIHASSKAVSRI